MRDWKVTFGPNVLTQHTEQETQKIIEQFATEVASELKWLYNEVNYLYIPDYASPTIWPAISDAHLNISKTAVLKGILCNMQFFEDT